MNQEQTIKLLLLGKKAWNDWAEAMLASKKNLSNEAKHQLQEINDSKLAIKDASDSWISESVADFSGIKFVLVSGEMSDQKNLAAQSKIVELGSLDFKEFVFPGVSDFSSVEFDDVVRFSNAEFKEHADLTEAKFDKTAVFRDVNFLNVSFFRAKFG